VIKRVKSQTPPKPPLQMRPSFSPLPYVRLIPFLAPRVPPMSSRARQAHYLFPQEEVASVFEESQASGRVQCSPGPRTNSSQVLVRARRRYLFFKFSLHSGVGCRFTSWFFNPSSLMVDLRVDPLGAIKFKSPQSSTEEFFFLFFLVA